MGFAAAITASAKALFAVGPPAPVAPDPVDHLVAAGAFAATAALMFTPLVSVAMVKKCSASTTENSDATTMTSSALWHRYAGFASGCVFALGLSLGGMVRPSTVMGALSPARFDLTLWVLFCTALVTTFALYRVAEHGLHVKAARHQNKSGQISGRLVLGAVLFGVGWGLTGFCPGPLVVSVAAEPFVAAVSGSAFTGAALLNFVFVVIGMHLARLLSHGNRSVCTEDASKNNEQVGGTASDENGNGAKLIK